MRRGHSRPIRQRPQIRWGGWDKIGGGERQSGGAGETLLSSQETRGVVTLVRSSSQASSGWSQIRRVGARSMRLVLVMIVFWPADMSSRLTLGQMMGVRVIMLKGGDHERRRRRRRTSAPLPPHQGSTNRARASPSKSSDKSDSRFQHPERSFTALCVVYLPVRPTCASWCCRRSRWRKSRNERGRRDSLAKRIRM